MAVYLDNRKYIAIFAAKFQNMYIPPFKVSSRAIHLVADISSQIERYVIRLEQADSLHLRRANRIRTIHSSLAIEGNTLSEGQVIDILDGKTVEAPLREIQEVKNAIKTYELYPSLNPYSVDDLLRAHGVMMQALTDDAGHFRSGGVGVFSESGIVHMAPPAQLVPTQISQLFDWLKSSDDHLLIKSCVFHYEFEYIHPFSDGNGRTGRLWQSLILGKLNPVFEHLPVENMVYNNQQAYYDAIAESTRLGQCGPFIDFMLEEILNALRTHANNYEVDKLRCLDMNERNVLNVISVSPEVTVKRIADEIGLSLRQCERVVKALRDKGIIARDGSRKNGKWTIL